MWPFCSKQRTRERRDDRFRPETLTSSLGKVVDVSGVGARVRCAKRPEVIVGQVLWVALRSGHRRISLHSRIVRITRLAFRSYEIGVEFLDAKPTLREELKKLALPMSAAPAGESATATAA